MIAVRGMEKEAFIFLWHFFIARLVHSLRIRVDACQKRSTRSGVCLCPACPCWPSHQEKVFSLRADVVPRRRTARRPGSQRIRPEIAYTAESRNAYESMMLRPGTGRAPDATRAKCSRAGGVTPPSREIMLSQPRDLVSTRQCAPCPCCCESPV